MEHATALLHIFPYFIKKSRIKAVYNVKLEKSN